MRVKTKKMLPVMLGLVVGVGACGKKKSKDDTSDDESTGTVASGGTPGVSTASSDETLGVTGQLALSLGLNDASKPNKILVWVFDDNGFDKPGASFDVAADGTFKADVPRKGQLDLILSAKKSDGTYDKDVLAKLFPGHEAEIATMSTADIDHEVEKQKAQSEKRGGHMIVMTSIDDSSGTAVEQAESMRFIGMPAGSGNIMAWPAKAAKGDLTLGKISDNGADEAKAELKADATSFDLGDDAVESLATAGKLLKSLKNVYINGSMFRAEPFFQWMSSKAQTVLANAWSSPDDLTASRSGFYLAARSNDKFTYDEICGMTKTLTFVPPAAVDTDNGQRTPDSPYNSKGMVKSADQGDKEVCSGQETGMYLRKDSDDGKDVEINWSLKGTSIPAGWWHLKLDGVEIGTFDLATSNPVDESGHAKVFVPKLKVDTDANGKVQKIEMIPTIWDAATSAYVELQDLRAFRQLTSEITFEISYGTTGDVRGEFSCGTVGNVCSADTLMGDDGAAGATIASLDKTLADLTSVSFSYKIGDTTLRSEWRPNGN